MPRRVARLPREKRGYPVPFVTMLDPYTNEPDFRVLDIRRQMQCINEKRCGICGQQLGKYIAFIGGTRSRDGHVFFDPGMHRDCAEYAAKVCPFISRENAAYRDLTEEDQAKYTQIIVNQEAERPNPDMFIVVTTEFKAQSTSQQGFVIIAGEYTEVIQVEQYRPHWG